MALCTVTYRPQTTSSITLSIILGTSSTEFHNGLGQYVCRKNVGEATPNIRSIKSRSILGDSV